MPVEYQQFSSATGDWATVRKFASVATAVTYANNYHGLDVSYRRALYHLREAQSYEFGYRNGIFQHRLIRKLQTA